MSYLKNRMTEASSWAGLASILAMGAQAWATKDPQAIGATVAGLVAFLTPDRGPAK